MLLDIEVLRKGLRKDFLETRKAWRMLLGLQGTWMLRSRSRVLREPWWTLEPYISKITVTY